MDDRQLTRAVPRSAAEGSHGEDGRPTTAPVFGRRSSVVRRPSSSLVFADDDYCFACGRLNPIGLKLVFAYGPEGVRAEFSGDRRHQGFRGFLHGGIVATLLDEALAHAAISRHGPAVTAEIAVRLKHPAAIDQPLIVTASCGEPRHRLVTATARLTDPSGMVLAEASAKFMLVSGKPRPEFETGS